MIVDRSHAPRGSARQGVHLWCVQFCMALPAAVSPDRWLFAFYGEPRGAACPAPLSDPPGHPATRPFGFAALLGLTGSRKTRGYAPQTSYGSFSRQPCATRPRKRGSGSAPNSPSSGRICSFLVSEQKKAPRNPEAFLVLSNAYSNIVRISPSNSPRRLVNCAAAAPLMARWS